MNGNECETALEFIPRMANAECRMVTCELVMIFLAFGSTSGIVIAIIHRRQRIARREIVNVMPKLVAAVVVVVLPLDEPLIEVINSSSCCRIPCLSRVALTMCHLTFADCARRRQTQYHSHPSCRVCVLHTRSAGRCK